eukprot:3407994-Amphidinium_carterae.1
MSAKLTVPKISSQKNASLGRALGESTTRHLQKYVHISVLRKFGIPALCQLRCNLIWFHLGAGLILAALVRSLSSQNSTAEINLIKLRFNTARFKQSAQIDSRRVQMHLENSKRR